MTLGSSSPTVISGPAPLGGGGIGRHLEQLVEDARSAGNLVSYFASQFPVGDPNGKSVRLWWWKAVARFTPVRFSPGWQFYLGYSGFDRAVANRLPRADVLTAFDWAALASFRAARRLGYQRLELEGAMSHVDSVVRQLDRAYQAYPIESSGLIGPAIRRARAEYAAADVIWVTSEYSRQSYLAAGIPASKLRMRTLRIPARFRPPETPPPDDGVFRVVFIGSLTLRKGIPVLIDAFRKLPERAELILVGGSGTRGMRRYLQQALTYDPRVRIASGDPLPHLHKANVCVHPSYEDGFAFAPMEALACGVPVIVSEDTGMKEHVREGVNGYIIPTGDVDALFERLVHIRLNPLSSILAPVSSHAAPSA